MTAERHEVFARVQVAENELILTRADAEDVRWRLEDLRYVEGQSRLRSGKQPFGVFTATRAPLARLYVTDRDLLQHLTSKAWKLTERPPVSGRSRLLALVAGAVVSIALIIFLLIPVVSDQLARLLPFEGERALGDKTYEQIRTSFGEGFWVVPECGAPEGQIALEQMAEKLLAASDLEPDDVTLTVLDLEMINAFALPGGRIVVMNGLIDAAESPDEVAAVIAHEIGHVVHRDPTRHALRSVGTFGVLSLVFGDFSGGMLVLMGVNQLVNAQYSQSAESAADAFAHDILPEAGVSPGAMAPFFARLKEAFGDVDGMASHLASHPKLGDRVDRAEAAALGYDGPSVPILTDAAWADLREICDDSWWGAEDVAD
ncbi:M48 family metallopeptidase [Celeribacter litoreus]|uniref:M48 family metallopeptidase n=1 Tax=Celeribacter litoreus TaxID=2876714 RepID=UPI001CCF78FD|nr:M48 family metallopeptidase [Celeribacter litoreus]MCA0042392.1 M48 family metallopeptidase [Celeribacter litoreus]